MTKLKYTGRVKQVGMVGSVTGIPYVADQGEPFEVHEEDAPGLLRRHPGILEEVESKRKGHRSGKSHAEATDSE